MNQDIRIIRELANQYAQIAAAAQEKKIWELHADTNDLCPQRPIVFINELPWNELNADGFLTLRCCDPDFRRAEEYLRRIIFQYRYFPADMLVKPYFPVEKIIHTTGIGMEVKEEILSLNNGGSIVSHKYENQFQSMEDVEAIKEPVITYDKEASLKNCFKICEAIGDIIPVKLVGEATGYGLGHKAWDTISTMMNADNLLYALVDEPEMMHALMEKLTQGFISTIKQYEALGLLDPDPAYCHCTAAASRELAASGIDHEHVKAKNVWGRGLAQILSTVSPAMHDEFEIAYAIRAMEPFGMVYYGCCEPLDNKIDVVSRIPKLRKISITPWADVNVAAEAIGRKYVLSAKANPAFLPYAASEPEVVRKEIRTYIDVCRKNGCPCEITLKDISTAANNLENLIVWNKIAMEEAMR